MRDAGPRGSRSADILEAGALAFRRTKRHGLEILLISNGARTNGASQKAGLFIIKDVMLRYPPARLSAVIIAVMQGRRDAGQQRGEPRLALMSGRAPTSSPSRCRRSKMKYTSAELPASDAAWITC